MIRAPLPRELSIDDEDFLATRAHGPQHSIPGVIAAITADSYLSPATGLCEHDPDPWVDSDDTLARQRAALDCKLSCPRFAACASFLTDHLAQSGPHDYRTTDCVIASIAFDDDGMPDPLVHGPAGAQAIATEYGITPPTVPVADHILIDRVMHGKAHPEELTAHEIDTLITIAARRGHTTTTISRMLHRSYDSIRDKAHRLNVWDQLAANSARDAHCVA